MATHCAIALGAAADREQNAHRQIAVISDRDIGTAMGILMCRRLLTQAQAFDMLRLASQRHHCKLRDLALRVIDIGDLP